MRCDLTETEASLVRGAPGFLVGRGAIVVLAVFAIVGALGVATALADGPGESVGDLFSEYKRASGAFFKEQRSADERTAFYRPWRDRFLKSAGNVRDPDQVLRALTKAETLSNSMRDYPKSVEIIHAILKACSDRPAGASTDDEVPYWMVELGQVNHSAYVTTKETVFFYQSLKAFRDAFDTLADRPSLLETRIAVAGWLAALVQLDYSPKGAPLNTEPEFPAALAAADWAIDRLQRGFDPNKSGSRPIKRMTESTREAHAQLLYATGIVNIWQSRYDTAENRILEYSRFAAAPRSPLGIILNADRSGHLKIRTGADLDLYARFIDRVGAHFPADRELAQTLLIPARRYFNRDELQKARDRFEDLVENRMSAIDASSGRLSYLVEIWSALRSIYSRLEDLPRANEAAERAIEAKEALGQSAAAEKSALQFDQARESMSVPIAATSPAGDAAQSSSSSSFRVWLIVANVVVALAVAGWLANKSRRSRQ
jgi:tetratricopeptide (TPR) repeat protein